jgi:hypothetical protein
MTPGKARGSLGARLKGADKTVSRLKATVQRSSPLKGEGSGGAANATHISDRRKGQTLRSPPAEPGVTSLNYFRQPKLMLNT